MSKVREHEYDDAMHDYIKWQDELKRLLDDDEPDEVSIQEARDIIAKYEEALFSNYDDDYEEDEEELEDEEDMDNL